VQRGQGTESLSAARSQPWVLSGFEALDRKRVMRTDSEAF
jgi:hypothetical protein